MSESAEIITDQPGGTSQYLTFMLGSEEFGVDILRVQGIQGWESATPIPNSPDYVLGVTNLRGSVVPIIDLRCRFELADQEFGPTTVVIVVKVESPTQDRTIGMVVDGVSEVYSVDTEEIQSPPDFGSNVDTRYIKGLATMDERLLILLDIDELLNETVEIEVDEKTADEQAGAA
jgi:purine-binding chemotaxis protein CheW